MKPRFEGRRLTDGISFRVPSHKSLKTELEQQNHNFKKTSEIFAADYGKVSSGNT